MTFYTNVYVTDRTGEAKLIFAPAAIDYAPGVKAEFAADQISFTSVNESAVRKFSEWSIDAAGVTGFRVLDSVTGAETSVSVGGSITTSKIVEANSRVDITLVYGGGSGGGSGGSTEKVLNLGKAIPKKGVDYWTAADKQGINDEIKAFIVDELAKRGQLKPEFANDTSECTDTSKLYVLPDGYIYAYMKSDGGSAANFTNQIPISVDTNKSVYNGIGYKNGKRINSSGAEVDATSSLSGFGATGFIPCTQDARIRLKNFKIEPSNSTAGSARCAVYDASFNHLGGQSYNNLNTTTGGGSCELDASGFVTAMSLTAIAAKSGADLAQIAYIRLTSMDNITGDSIVTVNEQITYTTTTGGYEWKNTGHTFTSADYNDRVSALEATDADHEKRISLLEAQGSGSGGTEAESLPEYWEAYLPAKIKTINNLHIAGGKDCFSFPLLADIHIRQNLGRYSGILAKRILDDCYIPFALCAGDIVNRGTGTETHMDEDFAAAEKLLLPIRNRLLQTQGNHEGSWGYKDYDGDGSPDYYAFNFTPEKLHTLIYRRVGLIGDCHFDTSGTGYYRDDVSNKVRFIMLNTHNNPYEEDETGFAVYSNMKCFVIQQSQFDLVIEALSSIPDDGWSVITSSHIPLDYSEYGVTGTLDLMAKLLHAYKEKTTLTATNTGKYEYDNVSISVDFTGAKGEYIAHFAGHRHIDTNTTFNGITVITTRADGEVESSDSGLTKTKGTVTEQSFDVFTIDRGKRKIYATKIGAGDDREISY